MPCGRRQFDGAHPAQAGRPASEYLVKQLLEFKDDKRKDPVMKGFASMLSEPDMKNIAAWLHAQKPKDGFAKDKDLVAMGERIYRGGIQGATSPPAQAATAPTAPASRPSTRVWPASTPTTPPPSSRPSVTASAAIAFR